MEQSDREQDLLIAELDHENRLLRARNERLEKELAEKRERVLFPTMLRKMWSGGEVQAWLDENVNKSNT